MREIFRLLAGGMRRAALPIAPPSRRLPLRYWLHLLEGGYENELRYLDALTARGEVAIDVGANQGFYSYRLSRLFTRVYAYEVNEALTGELAAYNPGNITIVHEGLSSLHGEGTLFIPVVAGRQLTGWASLAPGNCPETDQHVEKPVILSPLDRFGLSGVGFIKIDVEGHEYEVLVGARQTLCRNRPRLLVEVKCSNRPRVTAFLEQLNYHARPVLDVLGVPGASENVYYVPDEQSERYRAAH